MTKQDDHEAIADLVQRKLTAPDELARDIEKVAHAARELAASRLKFSTIVTLVHNMSGVGKRNVEEVLKAAMALDTEYLKPAKPPTTTTTK